MRKSEINNAYNIEKSFNDDVHSKRRTCTKNIYFLKRLTLQKTYSIYIKNPH